MALLSGVAWGVVIISTGHVAFAQEKDAPTLQVAGGKHAELEIVSERGIGRAWIERCESQWPESLVVHLRLKGLESFTIAVGEQRWETSVSSTDGEVRSTTWSSESATVRDSKVLARDHPHTLQVEIVDANQVKDDRPSGYRVTIPQAILDRGDRRLEIRWIDFYR